MWIELHAQRIKLAAGQLLLELGRITIPFAITPDELDHIRGPKYCPVQHHLKVQVIHQHEPDRERITRHPADRREFVVQPRDGQDVEGTNQERGRYMDADPPPDTSGAELDPIDQRENRLRPDTPEQPRRTLPKQSTPEPVVGSGRIAEDRELERSQRTRNQPNQRKSDAGQHPEAGAFVGDGE